MAKITVCDAHEVVGSIHFLRQNPILNFRSVATCEMLTTSSPSVSPTFDEFTDTCYKHLICAFTRTIQKPHIRMGIRVNVNDKVKNALHMRSASDGWVNRQLGFKNLNVRAICKLRPSRTNEAQHE